MGKGASHDFGSSVDILCITCWCLSAFCTLIAACGVTHTG